MIKAQLLIKIVTALSLSVLSFDNYIIMFYISCVLPKLGMILSTKDNYAALLLHATNLTSKTPTINPTIQEKKSPPNKEWWSISSWSKGRGEGKEKGMLFWFPLHIVDKLKHSAEKGACHPPRKCQQSWKCPGAPELLEVHASAVKLHW